MKEQSDFAERVKRRYMLELLADGDLEEYLTDETLLEVKE